MAEGPPSPSDLESYVDSIVEGLERKTELIEYYYTRRRWRLFYFMLPEPDWVFHYLYGDILEGSKRGRRALKAFERIDRILRLVFENLPDNSLVVMCSDHGFTVARRAVNGNVLLESLGLLKRISCLRCWRFWGFRWTRSSMASLCSRVWMLGGWAGGVIA